MTEEMAQRVDAEIARLIAETSRLNAETARIGAETSKLIAEQDKLHAEAQKLQTEKWWYPAVVGAGFMAGAIAVTTLFLRLFLL